MLDRLGWMAGCLVIWAAGCASAPDQSDRAPQPGARPGADHAAGLPSAAPGSSSGAAPGSSAVGAPPSGEVVSELVAVSDVPYDLTLLSLDDTVLAVGHEYTAGQTAFPMGVVTGDRYVEKPALSQFGVFHHIVDARGSSAKGVDLLVTGTTGRTAVAEHWILTEGGGWRSKAHEPGMYFTGIASVSGSVVALAAPAGFHRAKPEVRTLRGPKLVRTVAPLDPECSRSLHGERVDPFAPKSKVSPGGFGGTRRGSLLAVGSPACGEGVAVEIWASGSVTSRVVPLPLTTKTYVERPRVVPGAGDDDAFIVYGEVFAFDGTNVKALPALPAPAWDVAVGPGGSVYALTDALAGEDPKTGKPTVTRPPQLHRLDAGAWRVVPLPVTPSSMASDASGTLWVVGGRTLFRTRKTDGERGVTIASRKEAPDGGAGAATKKRPLLRAPRAPGPLCPSNLVVLYGFTKVTPEDFDFPATRKALKGRTEYASTRFVVAKGGGEKFFSALVPDVKTGKKLLALIEKEVAGSKPQLVCAEPEIVRELKIDLETGNVVK